MNRKRYICLMLVILLFAFFIYGCNNKENSNDTSNFSSGASQGFTLNKTNNAYLDCDYGFQLQDPQEGEEVVVLHTNFGDVFIRLFPEGAPKAVENFKSLIKSGYYNGITFHRVIENFMIQGGDPLGNGTGGESIWKSDFEDEFNKKLLNLRGSLSMANSGVNSNGSQFFINQAGPEKFGSREDYDYDKLYNQHKVIYNQYKSTYSGFSSYYPTFSKFLKEYVKGINPISSQVPDEVWDVYEKQGGNISLDGAWRESGGHTVFGQVYEGMDVVDKIAQVEVDENDKPLKDVIIKSSEIIKYSKQ